MRARHRFARAPTTGRSQPLRRLVILPLIAVVPAACGGSSATPHFTARAAAICARADRQIEALPPASGGARAQAALLRKAFAIAQLEYARLDRLTAPGGHEALFSSALGEQARLLRIGQREVAALERGELGAAYRLLDESDRYAGTYDLAMEALGLRQCAASPQPRGKS